MSKITLQNITNLDSPTSIAQINANSGIIQTAFDNTLSRDGTSPNVMSSNFDMNSNQILNLPVPSSASSPLRLADLNSFVGGGTVSNIPAGGTSGQVLAKTSSSDYAIGWTTNPTITLPITSLTGSTTSSVIAGLISDETGTGNLVFSTSPTLVTPLLGTPTSGVLTTCTGLPISTGVTGLGSGVATFLGTATSANLKAALTDETGSGSAVFATSPTLVTPLLGTPTSGVLTNCTGLPLSGHTTQAAFTLVGNNTSSVATPTAVDISLLTSKATPAGTDLVMISDQAASGAWKKVLVSALTTGSSVASIAGNTGAFTLSNGITNSTNDIRLNIGHLPGETSTGNAASGEIGEYVVSDIASPGASLTNATAKNITSISLTAGDWDVRASYSTNGTGTTTVGMVNGGISLVSASVDITNGRSTAAFYANATVYNFAPTASSVGPVRLSLSTTTTVFLVISSVFGASTSTAYGNISARRAR